MKWMHLADLHIGKNHEAADLEPDQRAVLNEILDIAQREAPDGVLIAGDIYDRPSPAERFVNMLNDFLIKLCALCPVYMISGNHDSGGRLAFAADLLARQKLYIAGTYDGKIKPIHQGDTDLYLMPYLHPTEVRRVLKDDSISTMDDAARAVLATCEPGTGRHRILLAHLIATANGQKPDTCKSEQEYIGGIDNVDISAFEGFDYVALGHIHGPQKVGRDTIRYAGTPMMYSFSEQHHHKSVCMVDLDAPEPIRLIPLTAGRRMRSIRGTLAELLDQAHDPLSHHDIVLAELTDPDPQMQAQARLAAIYDTVLIQYVGLKGASEGTYDPKLNSLDDPLALFEAFFKERNGGTEMTEEQRATVQDLLEKSKEAEACS